jgi:autophagy-related protein 2
MFMLTQLTDPALRRLYKFVVKRLIGQYLVDELDMDQLNVSMRSGTIELNDLDLNPEAICGSLPAIPCKMVRGSIGTAKVTVCYQQILEESVAIELRDVELVFHPFEARVQADAPSKSTAESPAEDESANAATTEPDANCKEGLDFLASWIDQISSKIRLSVVNMSIRCEDPESGTAAVLRIPSADFFDEQSTDFSNVESKCALLMPAHFLSN